VRALLGAHLVRDPVADAPSHRVGRIVEVEAYIGQEDLASHARFGRTARNGVMFGPPGIAYVYLVYGMYECLNVVTEPEGQPAAVLIRAVEPVEGQAAMRQARLGHALQRARGDDARARTTNRLGTLAPARLASGPGLVAAAFGITRAETGVDLLDPSSSLRLEPGRPAARIATTSRVGIGYAAQPWRDRPWRFIDADSHSVSTR
jgi:DNA-3-methyladenine glycosylase